MGPRPQLRLVEPVCHRRVERLVDQRRLAGAGDAGDAAEDAERDRHVDPLQVVLAGTLDDQLAPRLAAPLRHRDLALAGEVLAGERRRVGLHLLRRALRDHVPTVLAGAGAEVEEVVGRAHRPLVVLHHDHRVSEIAEAFEGLDELGVVALVQPDRGLVEDVEDADQAGADLRREPDPLRLAAGQRPGRARQVQVADADVVEEGEPLGDLADEQPRDRPLRVGHLELLDPDERRARRHLGVLVDRDPADLDGEALRPQARALADRAGLLRHIALDPLADRVGVGLAVAALEVVDDPLEADAVGAAAPEAIRVGHLVALTAGAVEKDLAVLVREVLPGDVGVDAVVLGDRLDQSLPVARMPGAPGLQRALGERQGRIGHHQLGVHDALEAEPVTAIARTVRGVEGEDPGLELGDRGTAVETGEALAEGEAVRDPLRQLPGALRSLHAADVLGRLALLRLAGAPLLEHVDLDDSTRQRGRRLDRLGEPAAEVPLHHQAVDDHRDVVVVLLVELDLLVEASQLVVHADAAVALEAELLEEVLELPLAAADDRRHHHESRPLIEGHDAVGDLLDRLPLDRLAALGAVRLPDPSPQQAQVVVDLGHRAHGGTRVPRGGLLVDRDRR